MPPRPPALGVEPHKPLYANQLSDGLRTGKYMLIERFSTHPIMQGFGTQTTPVVIPTLPTTGADGITALHFADAVGNGYIEMYQTTAQAAFPSIHASKGLLFGGDLIANETVEYVPGGNRASNPLGYLAGTDPGVFIRATVEIADASGIDQLIFGFRKQENYVVPVSFLSAGDALYTDFFGIGFSGAADPNDVKVMSDIGNSGSTTVTDTLFNFADNGIHKFEVQIKGRAARAFINGSPLGSSISKDGIGTAITAQPTSSTPAYTVTSGLFMVPFFVNRYDATTPAAAYLRRLEVGQLLEVGLQPDAR